MEEGERSVHSIKSSSVTVYTLFPLMESNSFFTFRDEFFNISPDRLGVDGGGRRGSRRVGGFGRGGVRPGDFGMRFLLALKMK